jgi:uncharacterized protein DUF748
VRLRDLTAALGRHTRFPGLVLAIAVALIAVRLALPYIVRDYVNGRLHHLDAYDGSVADVDIGLWRGAYRIDRIEIVKTAGHKQPAPFFDSRRVDFSVEWRSLLHGSLVAEAHFYQPKLNLVQSADERQAQLGTEEDWHERLEELFPFQFNTVEVHDGTITFRTPGIAVGDALTAHNVHGILTNISNVEKSGKETFAEFRMTGDVLGGAQTWVWGSAEPFEKRAKFDLNLGLENVSIPEVNPWLREYLKADAKRGDFALYLEVASANGRYEGYAKPIAKDVQFLGLEDPVRHPLRSLWKGALQLAAELFENQSRKQLAAKIPFSGTIAGEQTDILAAIGSVLKNAFVAAFTRSIDESISLQDVEGRANG